MSETMKNKIWIDNDACPKRIREIIFKAGMRKKIPIKIVANSYMHPPKGLDVEMIVVNDGFDAADNYIAENVAKDDLVITADIPLADRVISSGATALSPHGELYDQASIQERLAMRNLMAELRSAGEVRGGKGEFGDRDVKLFAAVFDRIIANF